jgi:hypothetical protein
MIFYDKRLIISHLYASNLQRYSNYEFFHPFAFASTPTCCNMAQTMSWQLIVASALIPLVIYLLFVRLTRNNGNPKELPLPPGPKGHPFIGNLLDVRGKDMTTVMWKWVEEYGMHLVCVLSSRYTDESARSHRALQVIWRPCHYSQHPSRNQRPPGGASEELLGEA